MRSVYRKIAKKHGVSVEEVKREMQAAIDSAYKKSGKTEGEKAAQAGVPSAGAIPSPGEFIQHIAGKVGKKL